MVSIRLGEITNYDATEQPRKSLEVASHLAKGKAGDEIDSSHCSDSSLIGRLGPLPQEALMEGSDEATCQSYSAS